MKVKKEVTEDKSKSFCSSAIKSSLRNSVNVINTKADLKSKITLQNDSTSFKKNSKLISKTDSIKNPKVDSSLPKQNSKINKNLKLEITSKENAKENSNSSKRNSKIDSSFSNVNPKVNVSLSKQNSERVPSTSKLNPKRLSSTFKPDPKALSSTSTKPNPKAVLRSSIQNLRHSSASKQNLQVISNSSKSCNVNIDNKFDAQSKKVLPRTILKNSTRMCNRNRHPLSETSNNKPSALKLSEDSNLIDSKYIKKMKSKVNPDLKKNSKCIKFKDESEVSSFEQMENIFEEGSAEKDLMPRKEKVKYNERSKSKYEGSSALVSTSSDKLCKTLKSKSLKSKPIIASKLIPTKFKCIKINPDESSKIGKNKTSSSKGKMRGKQNLDKKVMSDSDESDLEDVDELSEIFCGSQPKEKGEGNVQIELEASNVLWGMNKRKRRTQEHMIEDYLRKQVNKSIKQVHENMHKTHLLCLFAHGMYVNSVLKSEALLGSALSIIPKHYFSPKRFDMTHLEKFLSWFIKQIRVEPNNIENNGENYDVQNVLEKGFETKSVSCFRDLVRMFVVISRAIGMTCRLVHSLYPLSWKPPSESLCKPIKADSNKSSNKQKVDHEIQPTTANVHQKLLNKKEKNTRKMISSDSEYDLPGNNKSKLMNKKQKSNKSFESSDDDDFEEENVKLKKLVKRMKTCSKAKKRKSLDTDDASSKKKLKKEPLSEWAEVYMEEEEKWIPVDVARNKIHCAGEIEARAPPTLAYVVAYNPDQTVKDVTRRYVSSWLSYKNKIRCDDEWWTESLETFIGKNDKKSRKEDKELEKNLEMQPLPKTINEYKNHPLYALQRHLLKFEAIYPPDESPVGFIKGEPVFPRESVKVLHKRENWLKDAKVIKVGEEPYKIVKAIPKWDRVTCQLIKDRPLEIFGEWQTEDYDPPTAKNGKVPRNEYGNVELFKSCMLPKGCVHIPLIGLNRVARKLNIDCVPAMVGFEYHAGRCHPLYDGFVICKEFEDILLDAYKQDQIEQVKKDEEKRIKRIYGNWKKIINNILLKDRIKEKYGAKEEVEDKKFLVESEPHKITRKVKQEDLDTLSSSLITHSIVNLKIDLSSVCERNKKKKYTKRRKPQIKLPVKKADSNLKEEFESTENDVVQPDTLSSESEEDVLTLKEKQEKIRNILKWNPDKALGGSDPDLSDDSENDCNGLLSNKKLNPNKTKIPTLTTQITSKTKKSCVLKNKRILKTKGNMESGSDKCMSEASSSESDSNSKKVFPKVSSSQLGVKRRSMRLVKSVKDVTYKESDYEKSDISVDDSDTADKTYNPQLEKSKKSSDLDLSSESN